MGNAFTAIHAGLLGSKDEVRMLMVGLDGAGKTTILYKLKLGEVTTTIPTPGFQVETCGYKNVHFKTLSLGGEDKFRGLRRSYYQNIDGLILVVDSTDSNRFVDVKEELLEILSEDGLSGAPLLVLANKQDAPNATNRDEVADLLGLKILFNRKWHCQGSSATTGEGLYDGLDWLSETIKEKR